MHYNAPFAKKRARIRSSGVRRCLCCTDRPEITSRSGNRSCAVSAVDFVECSRSGRMPELGEHLLREQVLICRFSRAESIRIMQLRWACSSAGRASALQAGGRRFDPGHVHQPSACNFNHLLFWPSSDFPKLGNIWEQLIFQLLDGVPPGARAGVCVDFKHGGQARMPKLSLCDAQRRSLLVQKGSVRVSQRVPVDRRKPGA